MSLRGPKFELFMILGATILVTVLCVLLGIDVRIAQVLSIKNANANLFANFVELTGLYFPMVLFFVAFIPAVRKRVPLILPVASVWVVTVIIDNYMFMNNLKQMTDRPRPEQTQGLGGEQPYKDPFEPPMHLRSLGKYTSFPSTAAAMGFALASPFFVLRKNYPKTAYAFLVAGIVVGSITGGARILNGRHYFTDVLWSAAIIFSIASVASYVKLSWEQR